MLIDRGKNAIMQIDFALTPNGIGPAADQGDLPGVSDPVPSDHDDTMQRCSARFPIALGYGAGGEAGSRWTGCGRRPDVSRKLVTLYLTPVFYTYMAALQTRLEAKRIPSRIAHEPEPVATGTDAKLAAISPGSLYFQLGFNPVGSGRWSRCSAWA